MKGKRMVEGQDGRFGFVVRGNSRSLRTTVKWFGRVQADGVRMFEVPLLSSVLTGSLMAVSTPAFDALSKLPATER